MVIISKKNKIFVIGLPRTASRSVVYALKKLGYRVKHYPDLFKIEEYAENFDVLGESVVIYKYKELDKKYPNAKFILTTRDLDDWLGACEWKFSKARRGNVPVCEQQYIIRNFLYGCMWFDKDKFTNAYNKHLTDVNSYFKGRDDLLIMNVFKGDGYKKISEFLGEDVNPILIFPHENKRYKL